MDDLRHLVAGENRHLAYRHRAGRAPTLLFLPGYMSDMDGSKATTIDGWAASCNRAMLRFDYGGCGLSSGEFEVQSLADWRDDALAMIDDVVDGPIVLVGSSMGGWLMLLLAVARPERVKALVGIASAPDFTRWGFTDEQKAVIVSEGRLEEYSPYGDQPYVTTRPFWESGEAMLVLQSALEIHCPVRLLHGQKDDDVPWRLSLEIAERLRSDDVQLSLVKDGDHRLSRPGDLALLVATVETLLEQLDP